MRSLLTCVLMFFVISTVAKSAEDRSQFFKTAQQLLLVHAVAKEKETAKDGTTFTFEITHIYFGRKEDSPKTFRYFAPNRTEGDMTGIVTPPVSLFEDGVWLLKIHNDKQFFPLGRQQFGISWPVRKDIDRRYQQDLKLALAIEDVSRRPQENQFEALKEYSTSAIPEISSWAIQTIAQARPKDGEKFLNSLVINPKLGVAGQIALDEALVNLVGEKWIRSEKRSSIMEKWVSGDIDKYIASKVVSRFDIAHQLNEINNSLFVSLLSKFIKNKDAPVSERLNALFCVGIAYKSDRRNELFDLLLSQIKEADQKELKYGAAYALRNFVVLDEKQRLAIMDVKKATKDKRLISILDEVLEKK